MIMGRKKSLCPEDLRICKYSQNVIHDLIRDTNVPRAPVKGCHLLRLRAAEDHAQMERSDHRVAGCLKEVNIINGLFEEFCSLLLPDAGILDLVRKDHVQELASDCLNDNIIKIRDQLPQGRGRAVGVGQEFICIINTQITHTYTDGFRDFLRFLNAGHHPDIAHVETVLIAPVDCDFSSSLSGVVNDIIVDKHSCLEHFKCLRKRVAD